MSEIIEYSSNGHNVQAELFQPQGPARPKLIILAHGTDGFEDTENGPWATMIRNCAAELSQQGFWVVVPNFFEATGTQPGASALIGLPVTLAARAAHWEEALRDAGSYVAAQKNIQIGGLVGFSLGGYLCMRLRHEAKVLVAFYPPNLLFDLGSHHRSQLRHAQFHHGLADTLVLPAHTLSLAAIIQAEGISPDIHWYDGATHGFKKQTAADRDAWQQSRARTVAFIAAHA
jgi:dienelactone hydrolase